MQKECIITNSSNGKTADAGIMDFVAGKFLVVALHGLKITMQYSAKTNKYTGKSAGLEFTTPGPQGPNYKGYKV